MSIAYYWFDSWLKLMNAYAEQMPSPEADGAAAAALEEEMTSVRRTLVEHEQALAVALQQRSEMETRIADERQAAERDRAELMRRIAERSRAAMDAEEGLKAERNGRAEAQAEVERLHAALQLAQAERSAARQEATDLQTRLTELCGEAEREQAASADKIAALTRAASGAEQSVKTERRERAAAEGRAKQLKEDLAAAEAQVKRLRGEVTTTEAARLSAVQARARLEGELAQLRTQAERERKIHDERAAELARQVSEATRRPQSDRQADSAETPVKKTRKPRTAKAAGADTADAPADAAPAPSAEAVALVVHFRKPGDWGGSVYVHYWDSEPPTDAPAWPGLAMTQEADGWWLGRLEGVRAASLVFNDNAGNQTANLYRDRSGRLDADGAWQDERP